MKFKRPSSKKNRHIVKFRRDFYKAILPVIAKFQDLQRHARKKRPLYWPAPDATAKADQEEIGWRARQQWKGAPLTGAVELRIQVAKATVYVEVLPFEGAATGEQDLENVTSTIQDALEGICYENDRQICRLVVERVE